MKISYNWLQSHIAEPLPEPAELAEKIIFGAFEVESFEKIPLSPLRFAKADSEGEADSSPNLGEQAFDWVFDIKVLPDRAHDCLSHQGIAREVTGLLGLTLKDATQLYKIPTPVPTNLKIDIQTDLCRRYMGRIIRGVKIGSSPDWVKTYLESIGQKSINNIVDATNIVMFDCGQPTHAFDVKKLSSEHIIVRDANNDESIELLGEEIINGVKKKRSLILSKNNLVISDTNNALAVAGVKGSTKAEVDTNTTDIVIEVANFDPISVRRTARIFNILTDSAKRFENELTPEKTSFAMVQLSALISEMCPDAVFEEIVDVYPNPVTQNHVQFSTEYINTRLGSDLSVETISNILQQYGYEFAQDADTFTVAVPFDRMDIIGPHDMIEEIGRAYGYNNITATLPTLTNTPEINSEFAKMCAIKSDLIAKGYHEVMNYTFVKKGDYEVARGPAGKSALRTNLIDGLKESFEMNRLQKELLEIDDMKIFEIGTVFFDSSKNTEEFRVAYGDKKGIVEKTLDEYIFENSIIVSDIAYSLPQASLHLQNFVMWSEYPYIARDVAVWVTGDVSADTVADIIRSQAGELLTRGPRLFDTFTQPASDAGETTKTSYALRMVFQSHERTLTEPEINAIMAQVTQALQDQGWQVR